MRKLLIGIFIILSVFLNDHANADGFSFKEFYLGMTIDELKNTVKEKYSDCKLENLSKKSTKSHIPDITNDFRLYISDKRKNDFGANNITFKFNDNKKLYSIFLEIGKINNNEYKSIEKYLDDKYKNRAKLKDLQKYNLENFYENTTKKTEWLYSDNFLIVLYELKSVDLTMICYIDITLLEIQKEDKDKKDYPY